MSRVNRDEDLSNKLNMKSSSPINRVKNPKFEERKAISSNIIRRGGGDCRSNDGQIIDSVCNYSFKVLDVGENSIVETFNNLPYPGCYRFRVLPQARSAITSMLDLEG